MDSGGRRAPRTVAGELALFTARIGQRSAGAVNNWRKHQEDRSRVARTWNVDPFSTGAVFHGWKGREEATVMWRWPRTYEPLIVYLPRTWLLTEGWLKHGRIGFDEVPSRPARN